MSNNMSISSIKEHYNNLCTKAKEWSAPTMSRMLRL